MRSNDRPAARVHRQVHAQAETCTGGASRADSSERTRREVRLYGLNAVRAVFARRPDAIRKLYLLEARIPQLQPLLKWCVAHRIGYRVVEDADLQKLAASTHHEGIVADVLREEPQSLTAWLRDLPPGRSARCGWTASAIRTTSARSCARRRISAPARCCCRNIRRCSPCPARRRAWRKAARSRCRSSGSDARTTRSRNCMAPDSSWRRRSCVAAVDVFVATLPQRLVYVIGAEGEGMDAELAATCDLRVSIPGSGAVESLNVAAATAVLLAEWRSRAA